MYCVCMCNTHDTCACIWAVHVTYNVTLMHSMQLKWHTEQREFPFLGLPVPLTTWVTLKVEQQIGNEKGGNVRYYDTSGELWNRTGQCTC